MKKDNVFQAVMRVLKKNSQLRMGVILLIVLLCVAFFAPIIAPCDPYKLYDALVAGPGTPGHILGTDGLGRDVLSEIIYGTRTSLMIGVVAASISGILGTCIGGIAGFFGGKIDRFISEFMNFFLMTHVHHDRNRPDFVDRQRAFNACAGDLLKGENVRQERAGDGRKPLQHHVQAHYSKRDFPDYRADHDERFQRDPVRSRPVVLRLR